MELVSVGFWLLTLDWLSPLYGC
eukprot:COSAG06_NODE_44963_length_357_cov_12.131274_1_plen_22_part_10